MMELTNSKHEEMGYIDTLVWDMKANGIAEECFNLMVKRVNEHYGDKTPVNENDIELVSRKMKKLIYIH